MRADPTDTDHEGPAAGSAAAAWRPGAAVAAVLAAAVGCDAGPGERVPSVRDSAGVRIVENPAAAGETWTVTDTPVVEIGRATGPPVRQFDRIGAVRDLSDGGVAVADRGSREVRTFGPEGGHRLTVGGEGSGPGELRSLDGLDVLAGDTLAVWDRRAGRLSVFGPGGELVRTVTADGLRGEAVGPGGLVGVLPDGAFVVHRGFDSEDVFGARGVERLSTPVVRVGREGATVDTVARLPGPGQYVTPTPDGQGVVRVALHFAAEPHAASVPDRIYVTGGRRWEIRVLRPDGTPVAMIRRDAAPRAVEARDVDAAVERRLEEFGDLPVRARDGLRRRLEETPAADSLPAISDLLVDADGRLWARQFTPDPEGPGRWWVFDGQGRLRAGVRTPPGLRVEAVARHRVIGVHEDGLGVERVRVHRLERG